MDHLTNRRSDESQYWDGVVSARRMSSPASPTRRRRMSRSAAVGWDTHHNRRMSHAPFRQQPPRRSIGARLPLANTTARLLNADVLSDFMHSSDPRRQSVSSLQGRSRRVSDSDAPLWFRREVRRSVTKQLDPSQLAQKRQQWRAMHGFLPDSTLEGTDAYHVHRRASASHQAWSRPSLFVGREPLVVAQQLELTVPQLSVVESDHDASATTTCRKVLPSHQAAFGRFDALGTGQLTKPEMRRALCYLFPDMNVLEVQAVVDAAPFDPVHGGITLRGFSHCVQSKMQTDGVARIITRVRMGASKENMAVPLVEAARTRRLSDSTTAMGRPRSRPGSPPSAATLFGRRSPSPGLEALLGGGGGGGDNDYGSQGPPVQPSRDILRPLALDPKLMAKRHRKQLARERMPSTPHVLTTPSDAAVDVGALRRELTRAQTRMHHAAEQVKDNVAWVSSHLPIRSTRAQECCHKWGAEKLMATISRLPQSWKQEAFQRWLNVMEFHRNQSRAKAYLRLKGTRVMLNSLQAWKWARQRSALRMWVAFADAKTAEIRHAAAVTVQALGRGHIARQAMHDLLLYAAASRVQYMYRSWAARRAKSHAAAAVLQRSFRRLTSKRQLERANAATRLQALHRGRQARHTFKQQKSAQHIQRVFRGWRSRRAVDDLRHTRAAAATQMQALWKGRTNRKARTTERTAALTIQSSFRGHFCRTRLQQQHVAAVQAQRMWRGKQARQALLLRLHDKGARAMQVAWRQRQKDRDANKAKHLAALRIQRARRQHVDRIKAARGVDTMTANALAVSIQRTVRGHQGRQRARQAREDPVYRRTILSQTGPPTYWSRTENRTTRARPWREAPTTPAPSLLPGATTRTQQLEAERALQDAAAARVQSIARGRIARKTIEQRRREEVEEAARRKELERAKGEAEAAEADAAKVIQLAVRRRQALLEMEAQAAAAEKVKAIARGEFSREDVERRSAAAQAKRVGKGAYGTARKPKPFQLTTADIDRHNRADTLPAVRERRKKARREETLRQLAASRVQSWVRGSQFRQSLSRGGVKGNKGNKGNKGTANPKAEVLVLRPSTAGSHLSRPGTASSLASSSEFSVFSGRPSTAGSISFGGSATPPRPASAAPASTKTSASTKKSAKPLRTPRKILASDVKTASDNQLKAQAARRGARGYLAERELEKRRLALEQAGYLRRKQLEKERDERNAAAAAAEELAAEELRARETPTEQASTDDSAAAPSSSQPRAAARRASTSGTDASSTPTTLKPVPKPAPRTNPSAKKKKSTTTTTTTASAGTTPTTTTTTPHKSKSSKPKRVKKSKRQKEAEAVVARIEFTHASDLSSVKSQANKVPAAELEAAQQKTAEASSVPMPSKTLMEMLGGGGGAAVVSNPPTGTDDAGTVTTDADADAEAAAAAAAAASIDPVEAEKRAAELDERARKLREQVQVRRVEGPKDVETVGEKKARLAKEQAAVEEAARQAELKAAAAQAEEDERVRVEQLEEQARATELQAAQALEDERKMMQALREQTRTEVFALPEEEAARKIQAVIRGRQTRARIAAMKLDLEKQRDEEEQAIAAQLAAATRIQAVSRGQQTRAALAAQHRAATRIQSVVRGWRCRRQVNKLKAEVAASSKAAQEAAAVRIQAAARGKLARANADAKRAAAAQVAAQAEDQRRAAAAVCIQSAARGRQTRAQLEDQRQAAIRVQSVFRGHAARSEVDALRSEAEAAETAAQQASAVRIQAVARGKKARAEVEAQRAEAAAAVAAEQEAAAVLIQAAARGRQSRQRVALLRAQAEKDKVAKEVEMKRQTDAAVKIQAVARGQQGRKAAAESKAVVDRLQAEKAAEEAAQRAANEEAAAAKIQAVARGKAGRAAAAAKKAESAALEAAALEAAAAKAEAAAVKIQCATRSRLARLEAQQRRDDKLAREREQAAVEEAVVEQPEAGASSEDSAHVGDDEQEEEEEEETSTGSEAESAVKIQSAVRRKLAGKQVDAMRTAKAEQQRQQQERASAVQIQCALRTKLARKEVDARRAAKTQAEEEARLAAEAKAAEEAARLAAEAKAAEEKRLAEEKEEKARLAAEAAAAEKAEQQRLQQQLETESAVQIQCAVRSKLARKEVDARRAAKTQAEEEARAQALALAQAEEEARLAVEAEAAAEAARVAAAAAAAALAEAQAKEEAERQAQLARRQLEEASAVRIQAVTRGRVARKHVSAQRAANEAQKLEDARQQSTAATRIQAVARGRAARAEVRAMAGVGAGSSVVPTTVETPPGVNDTTAAEAELPVMMSPGPVTEAPADIAVVDPEPSLASTITSSSAFAGITVPGDGTGAAEGTVAATPDDPAIPVTPPPPTTAATTADEPSMLADTLIRAAAGRDEALLAVTPATPATAATTATTLAQEAVLADAVAKLAAMQQALEVKLAAANSPAPSPAPRSSLVSAEAVEEARQRALERKALLNIQKYCRGWLVRRQLKRDAIQRKREENLRKRDEERKAAETTTWQEYIDPDTGVYYYTNVDTGDSVWEKPTGTGAEVLPCVMEDSVESAWPVCCICEYEYSTRQCDNCVTPFCDGCFETVHATVDYANHTWQEMTPDLATASMDDAPQTCAECESETAVVLCTSCGDPFCDTCFASTHAKGKKQEHTTTPLYSLSADASLVTLETEAGDSEWQELVDEASGYMYYFNNATGETTWEDPR